MEKQLEFQFWKVKHEGSDDTISYSYVRTGVWQTRPDNAVEITEAEYIKVITQDI